MLTALFLLALIAGILVLARRWPDVEAKFWPDEFDVSADQAGQPTDDASANAAVADESAVPTGEPTAGGLMHKKSLGTEPDVEPVAMKTKKPSFLDIDEPVTEPADKASAGDTVADEPAQSAQPATTQPASADEPAAAPESASSEAAAPTRAVPRAPATPPGPRVMGEPARPSQPAYVDATKHMNESFEQLSAEADKAWRDRNYDKAEQACLKILVQQPKNHKYMTRIGQIYQETGDLEDAKEAYQSAKKLDPKNFFVLNRLSEVERMISDKGGRTKAKKVVAAGKK